MARQFPEGPDSFVSSNVYFVDSSHSQLYNIIKRHHLHPSIMLVQVSTPAYIEREPPLSNAALDQLWQSLRDADHNFVESSKGYQEVYQDFTKMQQVGFLPSVYF